MEQIKPNGRITKIINNGCISITYHESGNFGIGSATISNTGNEWYFNRLIVHESMRNKGIAKILMNELIEILDNKQIILINDINPYGDLNFKQLVKFYNKYNFKKSEFKGRFIRYPKE